MEEETFYTIEEVATKFKVTKAAVYKWMNAGTMEFVYIGEHRRITGTALRKFVRPGREALETGSDKKEKAGNQIPTRVAA